MHSAIGAAVAAQHVKDMLDQAAHDHQAAAARRTRRARLAARMPTSPARAAGRETTTAPC